jgi:predicted metal-dependent peptidase
MRVEVLLAKARKYVCEKAPYFARGINKFIYTPVPGLLQKAGGPLATSRQMVCYYDPVELLQDPELSQVECLGFGIAHEWVHHLQDQDMIDKLSRIHKLMANIAADLVDNQWLIREGWTPTSWAATPDKYDLPLGKSTPWYFNELMKNSQQNQKKSSQKLGDGQCGSIGGNAGPDGEKLEGELNKSEQGRTPDEVRYSQIEGAKAVEEAMKRQGKDPGFFSDVIPPVAVKAKVNWRQQIPRAIKSSFNQASKGKPRHSYSKPSTVGLSIGKFIPGTVPTGCEIAIARDTSGSMNNTILGKVSTLIIQCCKQVGNEKVWFTDVDAKVQRPLKYVSVKEILKMDAKGRGGTDFRPFFDAVKTIKKKRPRLLIYMTDGFGTYPDVAPPGVHTIWCLIGESVHEPPWGKVIRVKR